MLGAMGRGASWLVVAALALGTAGFLAALRRGSLPAVEEIAGPTMGTRYSVKIAGPALTPAARRLARETVEARLATVDRLMSTWRDDSELARFNRQPAGRPFAAAPETLVVLTEARRIHGLSQGAFDVTVAPLVRAWGFGPGLSLPAPPGGEALERARRAVGQDLVSIDPRAGTLVKARDGVECDLSAIAPGYAADRIAEALVALGHRDVLVDVGGELRAEGARGTGRPWRVGIASPNGGVLDVVVPLRGQALATSGDYANAYVDESGVRRTHVLDPRRGLPIDHALASVTVVRPTAMEADGLATALLVLGPRDGPALAEREGWAACFVVRSGDGHLDTRVTAAFAALEGG